MSDKNNNIEKLDYFTVQHEQIPYVLVHADVVQTIEDVFAGFIWVYLQSLPMDWVVNKAHLQQKFKIGDDKMKKHMAYLHRTNLIEYVRFRDSRGKLSPVIVRVLNGTRFNPHSKKSTGVKITPVDLPTGVIFHPVVSTGVKTPPVVEPSPERVHSTGVKNHTSGFYPPFTKEEEVEVKTTSYFISDIHDQRLLHQRITMKCFPDFTDQEFLEICRLHIENRDKTKYNVAQSVGGLCKLIAQGTFEPPASYTSARDKERKKKQDEVKAKAHKEAQDRQHEEYLKRLQEPRITRQSTPDKPFISIKDRLKGLTK